VGKKRPKKYSKASEKSNASFRRFKKKCKGNAPGWVFPRTSLGKKKRAQKITDMRELWTTGGGPKKKQKLKWVVSAPFKKTDKKRERAKQEQ